MDNKTEGCRPDVEKAQGRYQVQVNVYDRDTNDSVNIIINGDVKDGYAHLEDVMGLARRIKEDLKYAIANPEKIEEARLAKEEKNRIASEKEEATDEEEGGE